MTNKAYRSEYLSKHHRPTTKVRPLAAEASQLHATIRSAGRNEPWRNSLDVNIVESDGRWTLSVVASTPAFALLAANSTLCKINRFVAGNELDIDHIEVSSKPVESSNGTYAPFIKWVVNRRDRRTKNIHQRHIEEFYSRLWKNALPDAVSGSEFTSNALLNDVFQNPDVQQDAIDRLLEHTTEYNILKCPEHEAKDRINDYLKTRQELLELSGHLTRWTTIRALRELGLVNESRDGNPPLCPWDERVSPKTISSLVEISNRLAPGELVRKSRVLEAIYCRNLAMNVLRETTSRSLQQIGTELGGIHHSTVMYGLDNSRVYQSLNSMHGHIHEVYCQVADSGAIFQHLVAAKSRARRMGRIC